MTGGSVLSSTARGQYVAVIRMRWRMQVNALRSPQGKLELGARVFATGFLLGVWLCLGAGCYVVARLITVDGQLRLLPFLLWPLFFLWQVVPVMLASAQESVEFHYLLRFPLAFRSYTMLYILFGIFDASSVLGGICLFGIWTGIVSSRPALALWSALMLALFGLFNFLLTRTIFAWIERWLAQRKTREILGIVFLAGFLGFQLLNPAFRSRAVPAPGINRAVMMKRLKSVQSVQQLFPPGLAAKSVELADKGEPLPAAELLGAMALYGVGAASLLALRLRAEYRGENLGEAAVARQSAAAQQWAKEATRPSVGGRSWRDGPVSALLIKELRYLSRSGVMLFGMFAPLVFIFATGGSLGADHAQSLRYAFPIAVAYGFLPLTRQFCNSLGTEGAGIQLYFLSPTPFRSVVLAKNLLQTMLFIVELLLAGTMAVLRFGKPETNLAVATFCWVFFALPANLAAGNVLSIRLAYRMTLTRLSREQGSVGNGLLSLFIQTLIFAIGAGVYGTMAAIDRTELAGPVLLAMAAGSVLVWQRGLDRLAQMAANRREALIAAIARPA